MAPQSHEDRSFEEVLQQHRELKALLAAIEEALRGRSATVEQVAGMLGQLGDRLVKHFQTEEEGGYFAEALLHAPRLVARANDLMAQHPKMTTQAKQIVEEVQAPAGSEAWWAETRRRFEAFQEELLMHERSEDGLIQDAYQQDLGAHD